MEKINICRTAIGISIQASKLTGRPHEYLRYTTLNERLAINEEAHQDLTAAPNIGYIAIGIGAHRSHLDDNGLDVIDVLPHETTDTGLYRQIPFVLRQLNDDLVEADRAKYALRRKEQYNGIEYWAYYLKRVAIDKVAPQIFHDSTRDGVTTAKPFVYTNDDLNPVPPELPPEGVTVSSADIIRISSKMTLDFKELDVVELLNVFKVKYGSEKKAMISEIALCTGTDKETQVEGPNATSIRMKEAVGVQVVTFISTYHNIATSNQGFHHEFELGEGEPLLTRGEVRSTRYSNDVLPSATADSLRGTIYDASNRGTGTSTTASIGAASNTNASP